MRTYRIEIRNSDGTEGLLHSGLDIEKARELLEKRRLSCINDESYIKSTFNDAFVLVNKNESHLFIIVKEG